jgi:signal transduction histidine kinase
MSDLSRRVSSPQDPKSRLILIFAGAVLVPSIALSVLSFYSVPRQAEAMKMELLRRADKVLGYVEKDLESSARQAALQAARAVGTEKLLDGRPRVIRAALAAAGIDPSEFDSLRLEAASPRQGQRPGGAARSRSEVDLLREALQVGEVEPSSGDEDAVTLLGGESQPYGVLRFRISCAFAHRELVRRYFDKEYSNPDQVIRVSEADGTLLYETAPTPDNRFEVKRVMTSPSFRGVRLLLRSREGSIEREIRRFTLAKMATIAFIDLMLGAGLLLVYSNVRRELELSRLKSDFVANVSHELKTPLALIRLFAETLELGRVPDVGKARQYYRVINKESQRLTQLINNILDFSRIEAGRKEYHMARTDLGRVMRDVVDAYRFQIEQQGFELELDVPEDLPELELDKEAISQALINLVNNAIKYGGEQKHVAVSARLTPDRVLLSVQDRGIGIAKPEQRKIFEKFYRAEDSLVHATKGSGLGLSLVKHIVEAHGGSVEVESAPGKGSRFTLALPLARSEAP